MEQLSDYEIFQEVKTVADKIKSREELSTIKSDVLGIKFQINISCGDIARISKSRDLIQYPPTIRNKCKELILFVTLQQIFLKHKTVEYNYMQADEMALTAMEGNWMHIEIFIKKPTELNKTRMEAIKDKWLPTLKGITK